MGCQEQAFLWLLENKADVNAWFKPGLTLLHLACINGSFAVASRLIDAGADVNLAWNGGIIQRLGQMRPLELCCMMHHTKARYSHAPGAASSHERQFEQSRLKLMKKLLEAGARLDPIVRPQGAVGNAPLTKVSAVTIAASHHSIPMLELLLANGADFTQEVSAIHDSVYPTTMFYKSQNGRNPLRTLQWLVAHGVPMEKDTSLTAEALAWVCGQPMELPWKTDVVGFFISHHVHP
ncbi:hypothetical protein BGZ63DRAFT_390157, partial [Mariannaea sp. PMI_226]